VPRPVVEYVFKQKEIDAILVLDGLDESPFLARPGGLQNLINNLWDLRVPVVLSMRTELWHDKLQDFEASIGDRAAHGERRVRRIHKLELLPWRNQDIQCFLERFSGSIEDDEGRERLHELGEWLEGGKFEEVYGDIPQRPLFLRMIAETVAATDLRGSASPIARSRSSSLRGTSCRRGDGARSRCRIPWRSGSTICGTRSCCPPGDPTLLPRCQFAGRPSGPSLG